MKKWAKKRCWGCGSLSVICWGKQNKNQRFKCKDCGLLFCSSRSDQKVRNRFIWFKKWVLERQTYKTLSRGSGYSKDTLQRTFYELLSQPPRIKIIRRDKVNLRMDVTYFSKLCLVAYQDDMDVYTQFIRFTNGEHYEEIKEGLDNLV